MKKSISTIFFLIFVIGLIGCDHTTKHFAKTHLKGQPPIQLISRVLDLNYTENPNGMFSLLHTIPNTIRRPLLLGLNGLTTVLLIGFWIWMRPQDLWTKAAFATLLAGAMGNTLERLARGYVIDFIHLHHWPIFNLADIYLTVGAILLILMSWRGHQSQPRQVT